MFYKINTSKILENPDETGGNASLIKTVDLTKPAMGVSETDLRHKCFLHQFIFRNFYNNPEQLL